MEVKYDANKTVSSMKSDEKILVIQRATLFPEIPLDGFVPMESFADYEQLILKHQEFLWRSAMENDPTYKQIIPYLIFTYQGSYFVMQRRSDASEARLQNKYSLGIGGHIRQEDIQGKTLAEWAQREFAEEINYTGSLKIQPLGLINDDSSPVGQVHVGFAFLIEGDSPAISVKSELKEGKLVSLEAMQPLYENMETWSQWVFAFLQLREEFHLEDSNSQCCSH